MKTLRRLLGLVLFAALFWAAWRFTHTNESALVVDLLWVRTPPVPTWMALAIAFGLGVVCATALLLLALARKSLTARRYRRLVAGLESEIHQLRNVPLAAGELGDEAAEAEGARPVGRFGRSA